jgi:hypothetical protein
MTKKIVMRRPFLLLRCIFLLWALAASAACARDYYVSPAGDDSNPGTAAAPWRSIAKVNNAHLQPGDPSILNNHSGNGIVVGNAEKVTIEYCEAANNGWDMPRQGNGPVGTTSDPKLAGLGTAAMTDPATLADLVAYELMPDSPCVGAGRVIKDNGGRDFWGHRVPESERPAAGACQTP